jgi:hypothetical protein
MRAKKREIQIFGLKFKFPAFFHHEKVYLWSRGGGYQKIIFFQNFWSLGEGTLVNSPCGAMCSTCQNFAEEHFDFRQGGLSPGATMVAGGIAGIASKL